MARTHLNICAPSVGKVHEVQPFLTLRNLYKMTVDYVTCLFGSHLKKKTLHLNQPKLCYIQYIPNIKSLFNLHCRILLHTQQCVKPPSRPATLLGSVFLQTL